jgi:hypothetical protein
MDQNDVMTTAVAIVKTSIVATATAAVPTMAPIIPTLVPPSPTAIPQEAFEHRLDYATETAKAIYTLFPYIGDSSIYGGYYGCIETNDFRNIADYEVSFSLNSVNTAFKKYFKSEGWEFTDATYGIIVDSLGNNEPTIMYDAYRIHSTDVPALERLNIRLQDRVVSKKVRIETEITHSENTGSFNFLLDNQCLTYWTWPSLWK